mgnify:FL=1
MKDGRAVGVKYFKGVKGRHPANSCEVFAESEIILSAGAICSPMILERSGIGDAAFLERKGISVVCDVPGVGSNLQDHLNVRTTYECTQPITVNDLLNSRMRAMRSGLQYFLFRRGLMATPTITCFAHVKSSENLATPDIKLGVAHVSGKDRFAMAILRNGYTSYTYQAF